MHKGNILEKITKRLLNSNNKEVIAAQRKQHYINNKEVIAAQHKKYQENNREAIAANKKKYTEDNKEKLKISQRQYRQSKKGTRKCICGSKYDYGLITSRKTHYASQKHQEHVALIYAKLNGTSSTMKKF